MQTLKVLDHGYVKFIEPWGHGEGGMDYDPYGHDNEVGIIEAARQSTQGAFRGWEPAACDCERLQHPAIPDLKHSRECASVKNPGDKKLLSFLYTKGHSTPFEFAGMVLEIQAPIMVFREWHRHRTQSYSEASARYAPLPALNYHVGLEELLERAQQARTTTNRQASSNSARELDANELQSWLLDDMNLSGVLSAHYQRGLDIGVPKELARKKMPVDHYSRMRACCNLRNWLGFMTLRLDPDAQKEIRRYAQAVASLVDTHFPRTYELFAKSLVE